MYTGGLRRYFLLPNINASYLPASVRGGLFGQGGSGAFRTTEGVGLVCILLSELTGLGGASGCIHDHSGEVFMSVRVLTSNRDINSIQYAHASYVVGCDYCQDDKPWRERTRRTIWNCGDFHSLCHVAQPYPEKLVTAAAQALGNAVGNAMIAGCNRICTSMPARPPRQVMVL